jgi:hypothetical protein
MGNNILHRKLMLDFLPRRHTSCRPEHDKKLSIHRRKWTTVFEHTLHQHLTWLLWYPYTVAKSKNRTTYKQCIEHQLYDWPWINHAINLPASPCWLPTIYLFPVLIVTKRKTRLSRREPGKWGKTNVSILRRVVRKKNKTHHTKTIRNIDFWRSAHCRQIHQKKTTFPHDQMHYTHEGQR